MKLPAAIRRLLPFESRFTEVGGYQMHYLDEGSGPVVMLLHGNPTWCFYYRGLIRELRSHFRVIAPDFIGCGLSDHPPKTYFRAADRVKHLVEFVDRLGLTKYSLVMHDWGGSIGTMLASERPQAIEKLVYLNTTLTETEALPPIIKLAASPFIGKYLTKYSKRFLKLTTSWGVCKKLPKEVRKGYLYPYRRSSQRHAIWGFVDDIPFDSSHPTYASMMDLAEGIKGLQHVPVQIVWGLKDPCFHREMLNKVAGQFPSAQILEIPAASHLVLEDAPELAGSTIHEFLSGLAPKARESGDASVTRGQNALFEAFLQRAEETPHEPAVIEPLYLPDTVRYSHITFQELRDRINKYQRGLAELGLVAGDKVLMLVPPGVEFLSLTFAVMGRGAVPIFLDPGMGRAKLFECISDLAPDVLIGSPRAQLLRLKKKKLLPKLKFHVTASDWVFTGGPTLSFLKRFSSKPLPPVEGSHLAMVAFTSGATGLPKGVCFTHRMIRAQLKIFSEVFGLKPGKKDLPLLPIFSIYNLGCGVCSVFPPIDPAKPLGVPPDKVVKIINDLQVDLSFGSPTLWNKISEYCVRSRATLPSLEHVWLAGAPVPKLVLERLRGILENGEACTPYGATEALPVTLVSSTQVMEAPDLPAKGGEIGTFVGAPVPGVTLKVIRAIQGPIAGMGEVEPLSLGEIGEVIVQGDNVSTEYFERWDATREAKIHDGESVWHRMGDMGYLDSQGNLYFCGRKAHMVEGTSRLFYSVPTERIFNQHPKVKRSALVSLGEGREPGIVVEPHPQHFTEDPLLKEQMTSELRALALSDPLTSSITEFFLHPSFPVDSRHNAKIFRDQLSDWAQKEIQKLDRAA